MQNQAFNKQAGAAGKAGETFLKLVSENPLLAVGGAGLMAGLLVLDDVGDVAKNWYIASHDPVWKAKGQHKLYHEYDPMAQDIRQREALYKMKYDMPVDLVGHGAKGVMDAAGKGIMAAGKDFTGGIQLNRGFNSLAATNEVRALGKVKARQIFDQVSAIAPGLIEKNPNIALSIMQNVAIADT